MRAAVITLAFVALAGTSSAAFTIKKTSTAPRMLSVNAADCQTAVQSFGQCWHGTYADSAAQSAACCPSISGLMTTCGADLYDSFTTIIGLGSQVPAANFLSYLTDFRGFMDGVGSCPRADQTQQGCTDAVTATASACGGSPIADVPTCCNNIHNEITQCLGIDETSFFDTLGPFAASSGCPPFSSDICINAAKLYATCVSVSTNPSNDCCKPLDWLQMDCMNIDASVYAAFMPDATVTAALDTACNNNNNNGGGGNNGGSNTCDGSRLASGFAWFDDSNGGFVITTNTALASGNALFSDNTGTWYRVDLSLAPGASALSRQPDSCFMNNNNNNNNNSP